MNTPQLLMDECIENCEALVRLYEKALKLPVDDGDKESQKSRNELIGTMADLEQALAKARDKKAREDGTGPHPSI